MSARSPGAKIRHFPRPSVRRHSRRIAQSLRLSAIRTPIAGRSPGQDYCAPGIRSRRRCKTRCLSLRCSPKTDGQMSSWRPGKRLQSDRYKSPQYAQTAAVGVGPVTVLIVVPVANTRPTISGRNEQAAALTFKTSRPGFTRVANCKRVFKDPQ